MPWTPLDVGFFRDPKVVGVSAEARLLLIGSFCWCQAEGTDGVIAAGMVPVLAVEAVGRSVDSDLLVDELVDAELWQRSPSGAYVIPRWHEWNKPAAAVDDLRARKASGAALGNHRRWHVERGERVAGCRWCEAGDADAPQPVDDAVDRPPASRSATDRQRRPRTSSRSHDRSDSDSESDRTTDRTTDRNRTSDQTSDQTTDQCFVATDTDTDTDKTLPASNRTSGQADPQLIDDAATEVARREVIRRATGPDPVERPEPYVRKRRTAVARAWRHRWAHRIAEQPDVTAEQLADLAEPRTDQPLPTPVDATLEAQRRRLGPEHVAGTEPDHRDQLPAGIAAARAARKAADPPARTDLTGGTDEPF